MGRDRGRIRGHTLERLMEDNSVGRNGAVEGAAVQFQYLPVDERFYVRLDEDACHAYPSGAFTTASTYPAYALRVREQEGDALTEFLLPASDGAFFWVDMHQTRLARR